MCYWAGAGATRCHAQGKASCTCCPMKSSDPRVAREAVQQEQGGKLGCMRLPSRLCRGTQSCIETKIGLERTVGGKKVGSLGVTPAIDDVPRSSPDLGRTRMNFEHPKRGFSLTPTLLTVPVCCNK
jgi:hypothetical protein